MNYLKCRCGSPFVCFGLGYCARLLGKPPETPPDIPEYRAKAEKAKDFKDLTPPEINIDAGPVLSPVGEREPERAPGGPGTQEQGLATRF